MKENISKKEIKKKNYIESFFLLDLLQKKKISSFYNNFFQDFAKTSLQEWVFEKTRLKIKLFRYIHVFYEYYEKSKEKKKKKKLLLKKKHLSLKKKINKNSKERLSSFFDLDFSKKKQTSTKKTNIKKTKKDVLLRKKKENTALSHQKDFFFSSIDLVQAHPQQTGFLEIQPKSSFFLQQRFSYKIETEKGLSFFVGNPFRFHWIRGNKIGGASQYILDLILFFLKKRIPYRRICSIIFQEIRNLSYIEGIRITYAGRLGGKTNKAVRSKKETKKIGKPSLHIFSAKIDFAQGEVQTKFGMVGIKIWVRYK